MSGDPSKEVLDAIDERLRDIDDEEISHGRPPLSVLVRRDNGRVGQAFWDTVKKHGLRRDGGDRRPSSCPPGEGSLPQIWSTPPMTVNSALADPDEFAGVHELPAWDRVVEVFYSISSWYWRDMIYTGHFDADGKLISAPLDASMPPAGPFITALDAYIDAGGTLN